MKILVIIIISKIYRDFFMVIDIILFFFFLLFCVDFLNLKKKCFFIYMFSINFNIMIYDYDC